jgi:insertion element IS1 protein InsB
VSALSESPGREIWHGQHWHGALSVSAEGDVWPDLSANVCVAGVLAGGETAGGRDDTQGEWHTGYCPGTAGRSDHGDQGIKKKAAALSPVNKVVGEGGCPEAIAGAGRRVEAAEVEERWSFVGSKAQPRWLWPAIEHLPGVVLAYTLGSRADEGFLQLQKLLQPFGLVPFYTDAAGVYDRHLPAPAHTIGQVHTPQIERNHLTLRTRIKRRARKTIYFSKSVFRHDTVIGLFVNRYEFG